ncbi:hypothetical protein CAPTEDRAFT_206370 [Capitella teleta]|uniref:Uncharacterized protein n=1 Tax=Capitella teleta TaxID=283909 RepID=R7UFD4_CAPTE|nr:hypothetical protein CAPTEDRAFT_206370 [Capitella teleta]|eukprot:ELU04930.1 hypothetical protein CAPTEDRAFT_206370 [Capitella teleta]
MADDSLSVDNDKRCEILVRMVHDHLPREYVHQPTRTAEPETSETDEDPSTTASEEESAAEVATENRLASVNTWCQQTCQNWPVSAGSRTRAAVTYAGWRFSGTPTMFLILKH